jgi:hypothetical protein
LARLGLLWAGLAVLGGRAEQANASSQTTAAAHVADPALLDDLTRRLDGAAMEMRQYAALSAGYIDLVLDQADLPPEAREHLLTARRAMIDSVGVAHQLNGAAARVRWGPDWVQRVDPIKQWVYGVPGSVSPWADRGSA